MKLVEQFVLAVILLAILAMLLGGKTLTVTLIQNATTALANLIRVIVTPIGTTQTQGQGK